MKKVSKTKRKSKAGSKKRTKRAKSYPVHYLVIAIAVVITLEALLLGNATVGDWKGGFAILDMTEGISSMVSDVKLAAEPAVYSVSAINEFYNQATIATTQLMDASSPETSDSLMFVFGINNFYEMASRELASILDMSNYTTGWQPQVAGATISK